MHPLPLCSLRQLCCVNNTSLVPRDLSLFQDTSSLPIAPLLVGSPNPTACLTFGSHVPPCDR